MKIQPPIHQISVEDFQDLVEGGRVLERTQGWPSAIIDAEGKNFIKLWVRESGFSSDRIWPYGYRFFFNSRKLIRRGIEAPRISRYLVIGDAGHHVVVYDYLPGHSILDLSLRGEFVPDTALAAFFAELHASGVYFRSIHPGNILYLGQSRFALIDVTDVRFYSFPLSVVRRARNLIYAWTRSKTHHVYPPVRVHALIEYYCKHAGLKPRAEARFRSLMHRKLESLKSP